ncbi:hypothetical protein PS467_02035 [Streptomyces luomodiensis]|uniref:Uncharacterized protein n=1 Tax=Streptomyces luomodiensis TaxID=3026192 RepID=A0ABY9UNW7_9ACTN|nr:hypothetical protein [Streptomyces sp. SCA4-21]WNE94186.1 hypothetical protein PS467_02035 [Streptomyces sp. SCA4-21]
MTLAPEARTGSTRPPAPGGWLGWITTTDHKRIGLLTAAGAAAGALVCALVLRSNRHAPPPAHGAARTVRRTTG